MEAPDFELVAEREGGDEAGRFRRAAMLYGTANASKESIRRFVVERYMVERTILVCGVGLQACIERDGIEATLGAVAAFVEVSKPEVLARGGEILEYNIFAFDRVEAAIEAALVIRDGVISARQLGSRTGAGGDGVPLEITGMGVHRGELLVVRGTDVHWGDPLNTASKLGEDTATGGALLVTGPCRENIRGTHLDARLGYTKRAITVSGVDIDCFEVAERRQGGGRGERTSRRARAPSSSSSSSSLLGD